MHDALGPLRHPRLSRCSPRRAASDFLQESSPQQELSREQLSRRIQGSPFDMNTIAQTEHCSIPGSRVSKRTLWSQSTEGCFPGSASEVRLEVPFQLPNPTLRPSL